MMWPFDKKQRQPTPTELKRFLDTDGGRFVAKGGRIKDPETLKEKLMHNRTKSPRGRGEAYWDSVIRVIERHLEETKGAL